MAKVKHFCTKCGKELVEGTLNEYNQKTGKPLKRWYCPVTELPDTRTFWDNLIFSPEHPGWLHTIIYEKQNGEIEASFRYSDVGSWSD